MQPGRQIDWEQLVALALGLGLPGVELTTSWGQPALKAHGKLWVWWSPSEDAPVFKVSREERDVLLEAEPETFFVTDHYRGHPLVLVRPERLDPDWVRHNLTRVWRTQAPKRVLAAYDEGRTPPGSPAPSAADDPTSETPLKASAPRTGKPRSPRRGCSTSSAARRGRDSRR